MCFTNTKGLAKKGGVQMFSGLTGLKTWITGIIAILFAGFVAIFKYRGNKLKEKEEKIKKLEDEINILDKKKEEDEIIHHYEGVIDGNKDVAEVKIKELENEKVNKSSKYTSII